MANQLTLLFFSMLLPVWYYRLEYFRLLRDISPDFSKAGLSSYLTLSLWQDVFAVLLLLIIPLTFTAIAKKAQKTSTVVIAIYAFVVAFFFAAALGFFRIYETNFRPGAVRDVYSLLSELPVSVLAEINDRSINYLLISTLSIFLGWLFRSKVRDLKKSLFFWGIIPLVLAFGLPGLAALKKIEPVNRDITPSSVAQNPLFSFFNAPYKNSQQTLLSLKPYERNSLTSQKIYPRLRMPQKKYNVVLYFFESTSTHWLSYLYQNVSEVTPVLNRLRKHAFYAQRHYANFPLSINGFFNVYCSIFSLPDGHWLSLEKPDLPLKCASEILAEHGYHNAVMHASDPDYAGQRRFYQNRKFDLILDNHQLRKPPYDEGIGPWGAADERALIEPAVQFAKSSEGPFFLTLFSFNPHHPYYYGKKNFDPLIKSIPPNLYWKQRSLLNYLNSLHFADFALGELIDRFEAEGLGDDTIFVVLADHGEAFYEHPGNYNHPHFLYEENVRVPFLIYNRKIFPKGLTSAALTSHIDVLPTILDILGIKAERQLEGKSMFKGGAERVVDLQAFWDIEWDGIRDDRFKYLRRVFDNREELYDMSIDTQEKNNLAHKMPEMVQRYRQMTLASKAYKQKFFLDLFGYRPKQGRPSDYEKKLNKEPAQEIN